MNKDFLSKPISLKDINLKNIDFRKIKNKKEIIIGILILVYIIVILIIGSFLLNERSEAKDDFSAKESRYNSLMRAPSEEKLQEQIEELEVEKSKLDSMIKEVTPAEFNEIFSEMKSEIGITWSAESEEVALRPDTKNYPDYDIYVVNIKSFSGTFEQIEEFLEYVDNCDKIVRVDSIGFKENQITGKLVGQLKMSFYFKKLPE